MHAGVIWLLSLIGPLPPTFDWFSIQWGSETNTVNAHVQKRLDYIFILFTAPHSVVNTIRSLTLRNQQTCTPDNQWFPIRFAPILVSFDWGNFVNLSISWSWQVAKLFDWGNFVRFVHKLRRGNLIRRNRRTWKAKRIASIPHTFLPRRLHLHVLYLLHQVNSTFPFPTPETLLHFLQPDANVFESTSNQESGAELERIVDTLELAQERTWRRYEREKLDRQAARESVECEERHTLALLTHSDSLRV